MAAELPPATQPGEMVTAEGLPVLQPELASAFVPRSSEGEDLVFEGDDEGWEEVEVDIDDEEG